MKEGKQALLPHRLKVVPIIDASFEIRFDSPVSVSSVLPGILFSQLSRYSKTERLLAGDVPEVLRRQDPNFQFAPLVRCLSDRFLVQAGDNNVAVNCVMPYAGWADFAQEIHSVMGVIQRFIPMGHVRRAGLRYVNLFDGDDLGRNANLFNWAVRVGAQELRNEVALVRMEIEAQDNVKQIVQVSTHAVASNDKGLTKTGALLDIDTLVDLDVSSKVYFDEILERQLETLHTLEKQQFFSVITADTLEILGPEYAH